MCENSPCWLGGLLRLLDTLLAACSFLCSCFFLSLCQFGSFLCSFGNHRGGFVLPLIANGLQKECHCVNRKGIPLHLRSQNLSWMPTREHESDIL